MSKRISIVFTLSLLLLWMAPSPAYAYLDPGTGSVLFQMIVGSVLAAFFAVKQWGQRIKMWFNSKFKKSDDG